MNDTAKKLREAAEYIGDGGACSDTAIVTVRGMFDVGRTDTFGGDLGLVLDIIADELDELDDKATRRRSHIVKLESTIAERNRELRDLRKQVPTEREREILDMWPKFEDGEPVMIGDGVDSLGGEIIEVYIAGNAAAIWNNSGNHMHLSLGERVKRPARSVLDADGVEIRAGDTVWHEDGSEWLVEEITRFGARCFDGDRRRTFIPAFLTHTRPDSWERLEEDAAQGLCEYFGFSDRPCNEGEGCPAYEQDGCAIYKAKDIVRRAKALAGIEVD